MSVSSVKPVKFGVVGVAPHPQRPLSIPNLPNLTGLLASWQSRPQTEMRLLAIVYHELRDTEAAATTANFLLATVRDEEGRLLHRYRDEEAVLLANIDDYAFLIWGLLELYEATFNRT